MFSRSAPERRVAEQSVSPSTTSQRARRRFSDGLLQGSPKGLRYAIAFLRFSSSLSRNWRGRQPVLVRADQQREVLGHVAGFDRVDADLLQRLGELLHLRRAVELAAVREAARPGEDRGDRVGRGLLALLVLAVVARDRAVRGLGLDRLAVGRHQHRGHQAERAEALRHRVGLHVAVVVLAGPDEAAGPFQRATRPCRRSGGARRRSSSP